MRDFASNKYIAEFNGNDDITLNSFLFGGKITGKKVSRSEFYESVCNMLALTSFNIHLSGFKYMAALTTMYLTYENFDEDKALNDIAAYYATDLHYVIDCIAETVERNTDFLSAASTLLYAQLHTVDCRSIDDVLDILSAIFKLHFNYTVDKAEIEQMSAPLAPLLG